MKGTGLTDTKTPTAPPKIIRIAQKIGRALSAPIIEHGFIPAPSYLFLELIRRCPHRCNMCNIWKEGTDGMPLAEIERIFSHRLFDGLERVILTGGEPTSRKDIGEIGRFFARRLPKLNMLAVLTTGYGSKKVLAATRELLTALAEHPGSPKLVVQVSFDGIGETYNTIRNVRKAWEETEATVAQLQELRASEPNLEVMLHCVIQPLNVAELDDVAAYAQARKLPVLYSLAVISDTYFGNADIGERFAFTPEETARVQAFLLKQDQGYGAEMTLYYEDLAAMLGGAPRGRRCMMGYHMIYVRMDGKVFPCVNSGDLVLGDLTCEEPDIVWFGRDANSKRRLVRQDHCPTCASACYSDLSGVKELWAAAKLKFRHRGIRP